MLHSKDQPVFSAQRDPDYGTLTARAGTRAQLLRWWQMYKLRLRRRRYLLRALRKRRQLKLVVDNTRHILPESILLVSTVRNEAERLPYFLEHHRALGVTHFLFVANNCDDGTVELLQAEPDVSLWATSKSYKASRFGMDWLNWLLLRYAHNHWVLTLDADELFIYPHHDTHALTDLTRWLDRSGRRSFGALMIDLYPKGKVGEQRYSAGQNPIKTLPWFDADNYRVTFKTDLENLWIQGGVRDRVFFANDPKRAPTMSKIPLVKWSRRYAYVSSTHSILPRSCNHVHGEDDASGALLHTKFLPQVIANSHQEIERKEHFANSDLYSEYYAKVAGDPDLWQDGSVKLTGWQQLVELGLMSEGAWNPAG